MTQTILRYLNLRSDILVMVTLLTALIGLTGCHNNHANDARFYRDLLDQTPAPSSAAVNLQSSDGATGHLDTDSSDAGSDSAFGVSSTLTRSPVGAGVDPASPLLLSDALALVNRNNQQLAIQGEAYVQAVLEKKRAAADFLPTISFSPTYLRNEGLSGPRRANTNNDNRDIVDLPANLVWNLFDGYRDVATLYRNAATIRQQEALLRDLESSLMLDVVNAFYIALRAERSIVVLENSLKLQEERVRDITARRDAGVARPLDVAQTQAVASQARVALITARQNARNARHVLTLLLDVPADQRELKEDLQATYAKRPLNEWLLTAVSQRQDLQAATAGVVAAKHEIENAFGQYYPSVTLDLEYLLTFNRVASETGWNAALRVYIPIFTAGQIDAEVRIAWSQARQAVLSETYTQRLIRQQVTTTYGDWQASAERLEELHRQLDAAQIAYDQADSSYNVGLATNLERLDAQDRLLLTELDIANEHYFLRQAYLSVMRASGLLDGRVIAQAQRTVASATTQELQKVNVVKEASPVEDQVTP